MEIVGIIRKTIVLAVFAVLICSVGFTLAEPESPPSSSASAPLSVDQVVDNLVRMNEERAKTLLHSEATRKYHLVYRGFPGEREAEMTVKATYDSPATKNFKIISQSGSKIIIDRVFKRLMDSEKEGIQPAVSAGMQLTRDNYDFELVGYETSEQGSSYILQVKPKSKNKYAYRGKVWVDGTDFAVVRIEAEPAQNPSFWTKRNEIRHEYRKVQGFWLPVRNESVSYMRLGGRAILTIEYEDYHVTDGRYGRELTTPFSVRPN